MRIMAFRCSPYILKEHSQDRCHESFLELLRSFLNSHSSLLLSRRELLQRGVSCPPFSISGIQSLPDEGPFKGSLVHFHVISIVDNEPIGGLMRSAMGRTTIAILGAGKGGTALLELFTHLPEIEIVGIADKAESSPGILYARQLKIPTTNDPLSLIRRQGINLIMNVTGDLTIDKLITDQKHPETEVLSGAASKVLWDLIRHQSQTQSQLFRAEKLAGMGTFASGIAHDINNPLYILLAFAENILGETDIPTIHEQARSIIAGGKTNPGDLSKYYPLCQRKKIPDPHSRQS